MSTRNIMRIFRVATERDRIDGREWYGRASRLAAELDPHDIPRAAAVIAIPSPTTSWALNVRIARNAYALRAGGLTFDETLSAMDGWPVIPANRRKLAAVLTGADPDLVVSGPKVRAFWRTIANPMDATAVVVDRHAVDIYAGRTMSDSERTAILGRKGGYLQVADAYARAARIASREAGETITPAEMQAVTWLFWRRERAQAFHGRNDSTLIR